MGSNIYSIFDYPDQKLDTIPKLDLIQRLEELLDKLRPDIVYTHHDGDINHDINSKSHCINCIKADELMGLKSEIRTFEVVSSSDQSTNRYIFKPNYYVDIEDVCLKKIKLEAYKNELGSFPHPRSIKSLEALAIKVWKQALVKQKLFVVRKVWS